VTATGDVLEVSDTSHPDLFWALRGGGGNFGVATTLEFRLHPLETIVGGLVAYPIDAAGDMLRFYRDFTTKVADELTVHAVLAHAPDGSGAKIAGMAMCHAGSREDAERDLAPIKEFGAPVMEMIGPMPYPAVNTMLDDAFPRGALNYWKSSFLAELSDEFIDEIVTRFAATPSPMNSILFEHYHGAATRVGASETAVPHRETGYNLLLPSIWLDPAETEANVAWTRETYDAIRPHFRDARWLNYFSDDDREDAVRAAYGPNFDRLVEVKRRYDPENVFRLNHNIDPGGPGG
jgi:FAD/FMN-containing dehydrogenase